MYIPGTTPTLLDCAMMILRDECPPNQKAYLCKYADYECCEDCWSKYLIKIANEKNGDLEEWEKR